MGRLTLGLCSLGAGLAILLAPLFLTALAASIWGPCFWVGGALVVWGALIVDIVIVSLLARWIGLMWKSFSRAMRDSPAG
jgi:hypothetical protein